MPQAQSYGFVARRLDYYANATVDSGATASLSSDVQFTPDPPALNAIKRQKPAQQDLVWSGTSYAKTLHVRNFSQLVYRKASMTYPWYRIWTSSASMIGSPQPYYPAAPYDPMNPLLGKINGDLANIANMLGEYKQTASMFSDAAGRFRRSVNYARRSARQAKRGNFDGAYGSIRSALQSLGAGAEGAAKAAFPPNRAGRPSLSNAWLQWHFGVDTLLGDVHSLAAELQDEVNILPPSSVKRYSKRSRRDIEGASIPYNGNPTRTRWLTVSSRYERTLIAYVEIDNTYLKLAANHGLTNPASLVWELTTLSFVVDWFIGIGEWITALGVPATLGRNICYETVRKRSVQRVEFSASDFLLSGFQLEQPCVCNSKHKETTRTIRPLTAARPRWKPNASVSRVATALSLLRQMSK